MRNIKYTLVVSLTAFIYVLHKEENFFFKTFLWRDSNIHTLEKKRNIIFMQILSWNFHTTIFKAPFGPGPIHTEVKIILYDCGDGQHTMKNGAFTKENHCKQ